MTIEQANQLQYIYDRFKPSGDVLINHVTFIQLGDTCTSGISIGDLILVTVGTPGGQESKINSVTGADIISNQWFSYIYPGNGYTYNMSVALIKATSTSIKITHTGNTNYTHMYKLNSV